MSGGRIPTNTEWNPEVDLTKIQLPSEPTKKKDKVEQYIWLLYGPPKIGKSTLANNFKNAIFIAPERGQKGLVDPYVIDVGSWQEIKKIIRLLKKKKHNFKTIVVDTADLAFKFCSDYICVKHGITHPSDEGWGKGWGFLVDEFTRFVVSASNLGMGMVFISHNRDMVIKHRTIELTKEVPTLTGSARRVILPFVDIIGRCGKDYPKDTTEVEGFKERRVVFFEPREEFEAGDRSGFLPKKVLMDYNKIASYFPGSAKEMDIKLRVKKS